MKKIMSIIMISIFIISTAGCRNAQNSVPSPSTATSPGSPIIIIDSRGVEIVFDEVPQKVISLMPSNTEILYALGVGDKIAAVSEYCNYPEETSNKQKLPTGERMNIESIIGLDPDAAFIGKMSVMDEQVTQLEEAGIKVVVTEANNIAETYQVIEMVGKSMSKEEEASELINNMKNGFDKIKDSVKGKSSSKVYVEVSPLEYGLWSCGKNTFVQEIIDIVGAKNIFEDIEGWSAVSEEQIFERNPDIIFTTASPLTGIEDPVGEIMGRNNWGTINAVKNNKVIMLDSDMISRPGPRLLDAAYSIMEEIYNQQ